MEAVKCFNTELFSLLNMKIPISKAKMIAITRNAMKAIKFYKHVVQSVEKFIQKCKVEYKIPGLYVIDSIVRQSRHQFGTDKDVFAPRFARNMEQTFIHIYRCPPEEKSKIIRVLNLWQKNNVFAPEILQPLFDLVDPDHPLHQTINNTVDNSVSNGMNTSGAQDSSPPQNQQDDQNDIFSSVSMGELEKYRQHLLRQTQQTDVGASNKDSVKFNKKLLDYDYGSDDDDGNHNNMTSSPHLQSQPMQGPSLIDTNIFNTNLVQILNDPNILKELQTLQTLKQHNLEEYLTKIRKPDGFEKHLSSIAAKLPFANELGMSEMARLQGNDGSGGVFTSALTRANVNTFMQQQQQLQQQQQESKDATLEMTDGGAVEVINIDGNSRSPSPARYKRRKSRSRSPRDTRRDRRRRSRSKTRSRTRSPRSRRRDARASSRDRTKDKERDKEREIEKERRRRGLPEIKKDHLSVCSTTLWVGHLSKLVQEGDLSDTFGKFGDIVSIDIINPRGCAFIVMNRRQDAYKAMQSLKNHKLQGRVITISWAAGKGVKSKEWKDYWYLELGVTYIPINKLSLSTDFQALEEGGMFDEDTMPSWMKDKIQQGDLGVNATAGSLVATTLDGKTVNTAVLPGIFGIPDVSSVDTSQPPPSAAGLAIPPFPLTGLPRLLSLAGMTGIATMGGIGLPPPLVPGMIPGMPPMTAPPPIDCKSIPPPSLASLVPQFNVQPPSSSVNNNTAGQSSDDQMDIEMDEDHKETTPNFFSHPPPMMLLGMSGIMPTNVPPPSLPSSVPGTSASNQQQSTSHDSKNENNDYGNRRGNDRSLSREKDRDFRRGPGRNDRDRDIRERGRSDRRSRERNDRRDYRGDRNERERGSDDRSERPPRWGNRDNKDSEFRDRRGAERNDRSKERTDGKNVQERLRDLASGDGFGRPDRFASNNAEFPSEFPAGGQADFNMRDSRDDNRSGMRGGFGGPGRFPNRFPSRGGRGGMLPFNQRGFHGGGNFNERGAGSGSGFFERGGMVDRRGGMGSRQSWNNRSIPSLIDDDSSGDRPSRMPTNSRFNSSFDKTKRNSSTRWTASNNLGRDERLQERNENENWDQEGGNGDDDFQDTRNSSKNDVEDNGPPGFEDENDFSENRNESEPTNHSQNNDEQPSSHNQEESSHNQEQQREEFQQRSEPEPAESQQKHMADPPAAEIPEKQQETNTSGGNTTPLIDEPDSKE